MQSQYPQDKFTFIGGGIITFLHIYFLYFASQQKENPEPLRVSVFEKNPLLTDTTATNIAPSLTIDELLAVIDRGAELLEKLDIPFYKLRGIFVEDVPEINNIYAELFKKRVMKYSEEVDEAGHKLRTDKLLELGRLSMRLWQQMYDTGDQALKDIMVASNFNPCREPEKEKPELHDGYRIDLLYNFDGAQTKAKNMKEVYERLGYQHCAILSPAEVMERDPYLTDFCLAHSEENKETKVREWQHNAVALWRPGGCIDVQTFLPKLCEYLREKMGKYVNEKGDEKDCFQFHLNRNVSEVIYKENNPQIINGFKMFNGDKNKDQINMNNHNYNQKVVVCTGENNDCLRNLGFKQPPSARFAGASLKLRIKLSDIKDKEFFEQLNHCMEVHQEGVVLAWQARVLNGELLIAVAGTKAYYNDQIPNVHQAFAKDRNLLQLNMINDVLPKVMSLALGRDIANQKLTEKDLEDLVKAKIATRWVGSRAVYHDGVPGQGQLYNEHGAVINGFGATGYGSGGVSNAPAAAHMTAKSMGPESELDEMEKSVLQYASFRR